MNILFIHGNYPAQFRNLATDLGGQGIHDVRYLTAREDPENHPINGVQIVQYEDEKASKSGSNSEAQAICNELINRGEIIQREVLKLASNDFQPHLIIFHGGNGLGLFLKELLPESTLIGYFEWYFSKRCAKLILNRDDIAAQNYIKARNLSVESEILSCDGCVVPTEWQASQFPYQIRPYLTVIFDGVDIDFFKPGPSGLSENTLELQGENNSITIHKNELLLTYATRGMEPLRGFNELMQALPFLLEQLPNLKVLIGGRDRSAYGPACPTHGGSWKAMMLDKLPTLKDHPRITYTGLMNYEAYKTMLQRSNLHCYLTHPYVTSWSLFEAAACGSPILTNHSPATTGTIKSLDEKHILKTIGSLNTAIGIQTAISILTTPQKQISKLDSKFSLKEAMKQWQLLINHCLA